MERGLLPPLAAADSRVPGTTGTRSSRWFEFCGLVSHGPLSHGRLSHGIGLLPALVLAVLLLLADPLVAQDDVTRDGVDAAGAIDREVRSPSSGRTVGDYYRGRGRSGLGTPSSADATETDAAESPSLMSRYLRVLGWLVVIVGLAIGTLMFLKRMTGRSGHVPGVGRLLEIVARIPVTAKHQILVVRVGGRALVVGIAPDGMRTLCELDDTSDLLATARGSNFEDRLTREIEPYARAPDGADSPSDDGLAPYRREIDRLKSMVGNWRMSTAQAGGES